MSIHFRSRFRSSTLRVYNLMRGRKTLRPLHRNFTHFLSLTLTLLAPTAIAFDYDKALSDNVHPFQIPADRPAVGQPAMDPTYQTEITRITDIKSGKPVTKGKGIVNEYARADVLNADGSKAVFHTTSGHWVLYDMQNVKSLGSILGQGRKEPRWHATDPDILFYVEGPRFLRYNVKTKTKSTIYDAKKDYPNATWVTAQGEGDGSADSRYWALMVINYSNKTKKKMTLDWIVLDAEEGNVFSRCRDNPFCFIDGANTVTMSMSGDYVLVESTPTQVFDRDFTNGRTLPGKHGHGDLALSKDGRDVFVAQDTSNDNITMTYLDNLQMEKLMFIPFQPPEKGGVSYQGFHVSGNAIKTPGWVLVSTYGRRDTPTYWSDGSLFLLELKPNGRHLRVAQTNARTSKGGKDYWSEAFASIDRSGKFVFWGTNWGITGEGYADVYRVTLPDGWFEQLK